MAAKEDGDDCVRASALAAVALCCVAAAGGLVVQAFPHATPESIARMEKAIQETAPLSSLLEKHEIEDVAAQVLGEVGYKQIDAGFEVPVSYRCSCSHERALAPLALFPREELEEMARQGGTEVACQFCGRKYQISADELLALTAKHDA